MKMKLFLPAILLAFFFTNCVFSQIDDQAVQSQKTDLDRYRASKDQQMMDSESSPIPSDQLEAFKGLSYYPIDIKYQINAQFIADDPQGKVSLNTSDGGKIDLIKFGTVTFNLEGKSVSLTVFQNNNLPEFSDSRGQLFIPFTDKTTGKGTNGNGRYLPIDMPADGKVVLDFNKAINPYSAYNDEFSNVSPPDDNLMELTIGSGERKFEDR